MATRRRRRTRSRRTTPLPRPIAGSIRGEALSRVPQAAAAIGVLFLVVALGLRCAPSTEGAGAAWSSAVVGTIGAGLVIASWLVGPRRA